MPASAQTPSTEAVLGRIDGCRSLPDDRARLACFDRESERLGTLRRSGELVVLDRSKVVERRRKDFGLPASNERAVADVRGAEVKELDGVVRAVQPTRTPGRYVFQLADGTAWEMLDAGRPPKAGAAVKVRAVRLGGYRAQVGSGRAVMVKRVR